MKLSRPAPIRSVVKAVMVSALAAAAISCIATDPAANAPISAEWRHGPYRIGIEVVQLGGPPRGSANIPVLVLLDGEQYQQQLIQTATDLSRSGEIGPILLVSIKVAAAGEQLRLARLRLFTTPAPSNDLPDRARREGAVVGEVAEFGAELSRRLDLSLAGARANRGCFTLFGHSLAGHAALAIAMRQPTRWRGVVAASPSIWWGRQVLLREAMRFRANGPRPALLLTVGELEQAQDSGAQYRILDNAIAFEKAAKSDFRSVERKTLHGEDHQSSVAPALKEALVRANRCWRSQDLN
jgi:predicted alpha/beta superfamily hydrolase